MPVYESPGVYVLEVSSGAKPIAGVGTSTGAFVGKAERGVIGKAVLVTNWTQFVKGFGGFISDGYLANAVYSFFAEGGTSCYVVRAAASGAKSSELTLQDGATTPANALKITASSEGSWGDRITIEIEDPSDATLKAAHFKLSVTYREAYENQTEEKEPAEVFDNIGIGDVEKKVNGISALITVKKISETRPANTPAPTPAKPAPSLSGGSDGDSGKQPDYIGNEADKNGLHAFDEVDDINIVAIPDAAGSKADILAALTYCRNRTDCFFIADPPKGEQTTTDLLTFRKNFNSSYGALYYPWVFVSDPLTGKKKLVPPSGAVAGTYAYTDSTRGVHKAPAGTSEGYLDSVIGVESIVTKGEHDKLNPAGINVIRSLPAGICIWGARTLSNDPEWLYINIRRLFLYIEESIDKATQWVVFEPNDPALWGSVKRNITAFLLRVWRDGALFGSVPEEAFFVKIDEENNPPEVRDVGQLIIDIGVAPVKPAEFVIIRISQKTLTK